MASPSPSTKIGLDARAAELKQKLLRGRSQNQSPNRIQPLQSPSQPSSDAADAAGANVSATAATAATAAPPVASTPSAVSSQRNPSLLSRPSTESGTATSFVPHEVPRLPAPTSVPANAQDIAALISSISSAAACEIPGLNINGSSSSSDMQKPPAQQAAPVEGQPSHSLPPKPPPKVTIPMPKMASVTAQSKLAHQPKSENMASDKIPPKETDRTKNASPEEGEITSMTSPATTASLPNCRQSTTARDEIVPAPTKPPAPDLPRRESGTKSQETASNAPTQRLDTAAVPKAASNSNADANANGRLLAVSGKEAGQKLSNGPSESALSQDTFTRLLAQVPDLKDWLDMTDYYNVEARARKLDRFRRAKALAAEKLRIEEEERKLMEEEELEMGLHRSTVARLSSAVSSAPASSQTTPRPSLLTPITPKPTADTRDAPQVHPVKRAHEEESTEARQEKMPRLESLPFRSGESNSKSRDGQGRDERPDVSRPSGFDKTDTRPRADSRDPSPHRRPYPPSPRRYDYRRSPPPRPREYSPHRQTRRNYEDYGGYDDRPRRYSQYKSDRTTYPIRVDLGQKGDTRFFIVKSFNEENVRSCMEDSLWTTQVQNGPTFSEAFAKCKNVILFFSVNKSRAFQGYARMASAPSPDTPSPRWLRGLHLDTSDPFRVQWLSKKSVSFYRIGHLKNSYNESLPVLVGKDGQEIEPECGAALLKEMEAAALEEIEAAAAAAGGHPPRRESGGYHAGPAYSGYHGYRSKRFIDREPSVERR
ncbi:uncharacterized protein THITE_2110044 [Thermothielavioides terrestris NRRL 8126]|uniref:YTH domain-containing protein n=1 Tax=Thermothielavioides terrestris (strain ATCC 38088 / NRRL 8126) TaxID=578455 RepID=G2QRC4_THETT|nr:uncharacterized protein THITE_2110044 [Thermothielavioides terrestris NRRL 8126]AEO64176.1 hypothetical protein THITE_2110044 [Thermothielavioides terrestris NRRL 8126]